MQITVVPLAKLVQMISRNILVLELIMDVSVERGFQFAGYTGIILAALRDPRM
jgi:hypothetical protein